jgi:ankyrin repeat protein
MPSHFACFTPDKVLCALPAQEGTSIHDAACKGDLAMLQACIASGEDINSMGEGGCTALHFAADRGHLELVQWLIQHGAQLDAQDEEGQTALHYAAMCEQQQVSFACLARHAMSRKTDAAPASVPVPCPCYTACRWQPVHGQ